MKPTVAFLSSLGVDVPRALHRHPALLSVGLLCMCMLCMCMLCMYMLYVCMLCCVCAVCVLCVCVLCVCCVLAVCAVCACCVCCVWVVCMCVRACAVRLHGKLQRTTLSYIHQVGLHSKLEPTVSFLREDAGMRQVGRALTQQPALASLSVEANLRPKLEWLRALQIPRCTHTCRSPRACVDSAHMHTSGWGAHAQMPRP